MKKMTKWLALLLAGLMVSATLISCESAYTGSDDDDDDEEESESSSKYKDLSPDDVADALLEAGKFTVSMEIHSGSEVENTVQQRTYIKNGNILKYIYKITSSGYNAEQEAYADLENGLIYEQEDGVWASETEEVNLVDLLEDAMYSNLLLDDDNYLEYDSETDRYPLKESAIREELNLSENSSAEGYMTRNGSVYTFFFSVEGSGAGNCTITVKFTADKLTLPEVEESTNGNEGTVVPSPMPDAKN
ncbi:MAG: hypothetical protein J6R82_00145 [Clostridia bacterium]|nr:hypothetical protein [Clostridia bacterium]